MADAQKSLSKVRERIGEVIVGLEREIDLMLVALLSGGHILLESPPGLGKTTLANAFAQALGCGFKRIQMTPDLLPSDILGVNVFRQWDGTWTLRKGPIFSNVILVDEINRASPKVQSAFLEAMQERQVTIEGETLPLPVPFMVVATQIPYGEQGTFPLTSVQRDRFSYRLGMSYPQSRDEISLLNRIDAIEVTRLRPALDSDGILAMMEQTKRVYVHGKVKSYIVDLVSKIRDNPNIALGPSPRASIWLLKGSRVLAMIRGREYVIPDDVKKLAANVFPHRVDLTTLARASENSVEDIIINALGEVPVPKTPVEKLHDD